MRLTLRTLLSWKDGMLETEAARDLAARIAASDDARRLVERIEEVMARPTLSAPPADATAFATAANTTAEYLDNVLPAARLGDFERVCYASDAQLAETAAAHEILATLCRTPPAALDAAARRRILAAVNARTAGGDRPDPAPGASTAAGGARRLQAPPVPPANRGERHAADLPHPKVGAPVSAWLLVVAAMVLLAALVGVLGWSLTKGRAKPTGRRDVAVRQAGAVEPAAPERPAAVANDVEPAIEPAARPERPDSEAPAPAPDHGAEMGAAPAAAGSAATPSPVAPVQDDVSPSAAAEAAGPGGELGVAVTVPVPPPAAPAVPAGHAAAADDAAVVEGSGVVLYRPADDPDQAWMAGGRGCRLDLPVGLVSPPFCASEMVVGEMRITLQPGTSATLRRDAAGAPRLEMASGRAVVAGKGRFGLTAGAIAGVVAAEPAAPIGAEVTLVRPSGAAAEATQRVARILSAAGPLAWRQTAADGAAREVPVAGIAAETVIDRGQALVWRSTAPDHVQAEPVRPLPDWLAGRGADDAIARRAAEAIARRCGAGVAALPALHELAAERRSESRMAGAAALAMLDEFDELAKLIADEGWAGHWEWMLPVLDATAVQPALARGPRAADALARALADNGPPGVGTAVFRLARGFTGDQLAAGGVAELVAALESPHLVVRRYAIGNLVALAGTDGGYRAERPVDASRKEVAWWRTRLEQGRIERAAPR